MASRPARERCHLSRTLGLTASISSSEGVSRAPTSTGGAIIAPGERFRRRHNHAVALNSRSTSPTHTIEPPISISITAAPEPAQLTAMIETNSDAETSDQQRLQNETPVANHRADCDAARSAT